jgi:hypothetical protein
LSGGGLGRPPPTSAGRRECKEVRTLRLPRRAANAAPSRPDGRASSAGSSASIIVRSPLLAPPTSWIPLQARWAISAWLQRKTSARQHGETPK